MAEYVRYKAGSHDLCVAAVRADGGRGTEARREFGDDGGREKLDLGRQNAWYRDQKI